MKVQLLYSLSMAFGSRRKKSVTTDGIIAELSSSSEDKNFSLSGSTGFKALRGLSMVRSDHGRRIAASNGGCLLAFPTPLPSMEEVDVYHSYLEIPSGEFQVT